MSYDIYIGDAEIDTRDNGREDLVVLPLSSTEAPAFPGDHLSQHANGRHPGYVVWHKFCESVRLYRMFFDREHGLMREHPGTFTFDPEHLTTVREARARYERMHPQAQPGFVGEMHAALARLLWLEWWMAWALEHCERPAIYNS